jgi:hypothetical protein
LLPEGIIVNGNGVIESGLGIGSGSALAADGGGAAGAADSVGEKAASPVGEKMQSAGGGVDKDGKVKIELAGTLESCKQVISEFEKVRRFHLLSSHSLTPIDDDSWSNSTVSQRV